MPTARMQAKVEVNQAPALCGETDARMACRPPGVIPLLHELVGLPLAASSAEIGRASEDFFQAVLDRASRGDAVAQRELVALRIAYLNWAYANPQFPSGDANPIELPAVTGIPEGGLSPGMPQKWI